MQVKYAFIQTSRAEVTNTHRLEAYCRTPEVSRSGYYDWLAKRRQPDPDAVAALPNRRRDDVGRFPRVSPAAIATLVSQYREHPGWTMRRHVDNLRVALAGSDSPMPFYPTVHRYLQAKGMFRPARPKRATDGALAARDRLKRPDCRSIRVPNESLLSNKSNKSGQRYLFHNINIP